MNKDLFLISGASSGIGHALARHFAAQGHQVLAGVRKAADFQLLEKINHITPINLDVTKAEDIQSALKVVEEKIEDHQKLILVNNAGIAVNGAWEMVTESELRQQFDINFFGTIMLTKTLLPILRQTKGQIINISSISGLFASPFLGPYATSKYALEAFTDSLRREMFHFGVKVTSINPGAIKTPIWNKGLEDPKNKAAFQDPIYGKVLLSFAANVKKAVDQAIDVNHVVNAVEKAYQKNHVRLIVSRLGIKIFVYLTKYLPAALVDKAFKRF